MMKRRFYLLILALGLIATTAGVSDAYFRYYNGYGRGGRAFTAIMAMNGPYGNGYGYGPRGYGSPYGFGVSIY